MVRRMVLLAAGVAIATCLGPLSLQAQDSSNDRVPGMRQADIHNPASPRYSDFQPNSYSRRHGHAGHQHHHHHGGRTNVWAIGPGFFPPPLGGVPWSTNIWIPFASGMPFFTVYPYSFAASYMGPTVVPYAAPFGPPPLDLGVPPVAPVEPANPQVDAAIEAIRKAAKALDAKQTKVRPSNEEARKLAARFIALGDEHFTKQRYGDALSRYQSAARAAKDLAEPMFRQGQALFALGRFDAAAAAFKRGLSLDPQWLNTRYRFDTLYAGNRVADAAHRDRLDKAIQATPNNANLVFLRGLQFYFRNQPGHSRAFFEQALALGLDQRDVDGYLTATAAFANAAPNGVPARPAAIEVEL